MRPAAKSTPKCVEDEVCMYYAGMTDDERLMLEEMKRREQKLKLELDEQESEMRAQQQLLREQEAERNRLADEFEAMQQQVRVMSSKLLFL